LRTSPSSESPTSRLAALRERLQPDQRLAAIAAIAVGGSVFLPWWRDPIFGITYIGFRRLSFLEVAILLVAASVLVLLAGRAEGREFHLPLSDGTLIAAAGVWSCVLFVARLLDPPTRAVGGVTSDYGVRWGIFVGLLAGAVLAFAGVRLRRRRHHGQPESVAADEDAQPTLLLRS
jgi:hypothetical protein